MYLKHHDGRVASIRLGLEFAGFLFCACVRLRCFDASLFPICSILVVVVHKSQYAIVIVFRLALNFFIVSITLISGTSRSLISSIVVYSRLLGGLWGFSGAPVFSSWCRGCVFSFCWVGPPLGFLPSLGAPGAPLAPFGLHGGSRSSSSGSTPLCTLLGRLVL